MKALVFLIPAFSAFVLSGCFYRWKDPSYSSAATATPHFSSINSLIIQPKCLPCHDGSANEINFSTYSGVLEKISPNAPDSSDLYKQVSSGSMPEDLPMLSDDEILAIYQWIQNGAPND